VLQPASRQQRISKQVQGVSFGVSAGMLGSKCLACPCLRLHVTLSLVSMAQQNPSALLSSLHLKVGAAS